MDLNHSFTVNVPVDDAWRILTDVERIAPCLPGAQLQEIEGDTYRGAVKVKVGPIQAQFKGQANFIERNEETHHIVLKGEGRDIGGKGNASAIITADLTAVTESSTSVVVNTDLSITGKVAQFGRGTMADISNKLLAQFVENLNVLIAEQPATSPATPAVPDAEIPAAAPTGAPEATTSEPVVRKIDAPEAEALNLLSVSTGAIAKRAIPVAIVVVAVLAFFVLR
jgi:carbon monoxide dehydrogenase subunit G